MPDIAYVMTHYPQLAQTFIAGEIRELERRGIGILPIAINPPAETDLAPASARTEAARTFVIKAQPKWRAAWIIARFAARAPGALARAWWRAQRPAVGLRARVWQTFYLFEAILIVVHCRTRGVRHLHAHFGGTPAAIAQIAAELATATERERWTWSFTIHGFQDFVNERENALDRKAASASFVVCVSDYNRAQLMRASDPADWHKYHVVRCGIDLDQYRFAPKSALSDPPVITLVGRISPEKGHLVLLEALALLHADGVKAIVEFVGYGPYESEVRAAAERLGVAALTRFRGPTPPAEVEDLLHDADVFCLPSFAEGLPVSIMEAMAAGTPVVTTYISGIPELAIDGESALVVPAGNAPALASALAKMIDDAAARARMVARARELVVEHHSIERSAEALGRLLASAR